MNRRSPRFLIPLLIVCVALIVGVALTVVYIHNSTSRSNPSTDITTTWQVHTPSFTPQDQQDIQTSLKSELLTIRSNRLLGYRFSIIDAHRQGDWAILSAAAYGKDNVTPIPTEPLFFIAHLQGTNWTVWLTDAPHFCDQLKQLPDALLAPTDKRYFLGCYR